MFFGNSDRISIFEVEEISGLYVATQSPLGWYGREKPAAAEFLRSYHHFQWDVINRPWMVMRWDGNFCVW